MPENFLEINRYFAFTPYCNTIGQSNNALSILGFSLARKPRDHFSRSYENRSIYSKINSFTQRIYLSAHFLIWELPATCCLPFDNVYFQKISIPATEDTFVFDPPPYPSGISIPGGACHSHPSPPPLTRWNFRNFPTWLGTPWTEYFRQKCFCDKERKIFLFMWNTVSSNLIFGYFLDLHN